MNLDKCFKKRFLSAKNNFKNLLVINFKANCYYLLKFYDFSFRSSNFCLELQAIVNNRKIYEFVLTFTNLNAEYTNFVYMCINF